MVDNAKAIDFLSFHHTIGRYCFHLARSGVDYAPEMEPDEIQAYYLVHADKTSIVHERGRRLGISKAFGRHYYPSKGRKNLKLAQS